MQTSGQQTERDWEADFKAWSKPPGDTEEQKCANAISVVKNAVNASTALAGRSITVIPKGSYPNNVNVGTLSDVDVAVASSASIFFDVPEGMTAGNFGIITPATYTWQTFRSDVVGAITSYLPDTALITPGDKAIDLHENSYRVDADVVPCLEYRRYRADGTWEPGGLAFPKAGGGLIVNWPQHDYDNCVAKNNNTNYRYKYIVRALKGLRSEMVGSGISEAESAVSFLIQALAFRVPDNLFGAATYTDDVKAVLAFVWDSTKPESDCSKWTEPNGMKWLFGSHQKWTKEQVHAFCLAAWQYVDFK